MITLVYNGKELNDVSLDDLNYCEENEIIILKNDTIIGQMIVYNNDFGFNLEGFYIESRFRGNGFDTEAMKKLIEIAKSFNIRYIYGESIDARKNFYKKLGAKYENRVKFDTVIDNQIFDGKKLETFFIDL